MLTLLLAAALFIFFWLVGAAVIALTQTTRPSLMSWLLAPVVGFSLVTVLVLLLNQGGIPVGVFAPYVTLLLLMFAAIVLWYRKKWSPIRELLPFIGIAAFFLLYVGWPALLLGAEWLGYANDDMGGYCLAALRVLDHGFYAIPTIGELAGTDYSQYLWFIHVPRLIRPGSELVLAWVSGTSGLNPVESFMPTILCFGLLQLWALASLVLQNVSDRRLAILGMGLLTISPLFVVGIFSQLMAQAAGIALLLASLSILCKKDVEEKIFRRLLFWAPRALPIVALIIVYPEVVPFLVISCLIYWLFKLWLGQLRWDSVVVSTSVAVVMAIFILGQNLLAMILFLLHQVEGARSVAQLTIGIFPYLLMPSGFAHMFGILPFPAVATEPFLSFSVLLGFGLLVLTLVYGVRDAIKGRLYAFLCLVMMAVFFKFLLDRNGFATFKAAMFIQPVLMATLASAILAVFRRKWWIAVALFWVVSLSSYDTYVRRAISRSEQFAGLVSHSTSKREKPLISDLGDIVKDKLLAVNLKGQKLIFPGRFVFNNIVGDVETSDPDRSTRLLARIWPENRKWQQVFRSLHSEITTHVMKPRVLWNSSFYSPVFDMGPSSSFELVDQPGASASVLNRCYRQRSSKNDGGGLEFISSLVVQNWLVFVHSSRGLYYYRLGSDFKGNDKKISMFESEPDYFRENSTFAGVGRFLLFRVMNPTGPLRIRVEMTKSVLGTDRTLLPKHSHVLHQGNSSLEFVGRGSARVTSQPFEPLDVEGERYLALDFGEEAQPFAYKPKGLMRLYNSDLSPDSREIVAFVRDISVVADSEYLNVRRPSKLGRFPADLVENPGAEYSGIYEDGWMSEDAYCVLGESHQGDMLVFSGEVPALGKLNRGVTLSLIVEEGKILSRRLATGSFRVEYALMKEKSATQVRFRFDAHENLPEPDSRPISVRIKLISIKKQNPRN